MDHTRFDFFPCTDIFISLELIITLFFIRLIPFDLNLGIMFLHLSFCKVLLNSVFYPPALSAQQPVPQCSSGSEVQMGALFSGPACCPPGALPTSSPLILPVYSLFWGGGKQSSVASQYFAGTKTLGLACLKTFSFSCHTGRMSLAGLGTSVSYSLCCCH